MTDTGTLCACGAAATANGRECPIHYRARLLSLRLDTSVTETRTRKNYYDAEAVHETYGEDAKDRMLEETDGYGYARRGSDGRMYHRDFRSGEIEALTSDEIDRVYLAGDQDD